MDLNMNGSALKNLGINEMEEQEPVVPDVPSDFVDRISTKIMVINEREMDDNKASAKVAQMVYRNLSKPGMHGYFVDAIDILLNNEDTRKYSATTWASLVINQEEHKEYKEFLDDVVLLCVSGHKYMDRPDFFPDGRKKHFSAYAHNIGEVFINMMAINSDLYDIITEIFADVIRTEMEDELTEKQNQEENEATKRISLALRKKKDTRASNPKKLYDDIIDYISHRGEYKSDSLNQKNPNEFIIVLADRMRSTRRYVMQDLMNKQALDRRKQIEKDLSEREANAEEIISAGLPFKKGLFLFWVEKRYNFKYLAVEKVRVTLQIFSLLLGVGAVMAGYLEVTTITLIEGALTGGLMVGYSKFVSSRKFFENFYPIDVTNELEQEVGNFTPVFRKMSKDQLQMFLVRQVKEPKNEAILNLIPEYIRYIYTVMPERDNLLVKSEELTEVV